MPPKHNNASITHAGGSMEARMEAAVQNLETLARRMSALESRHESHLKDISGRIHTRPAFDRANNNTDHDIRYYTKTQVDALFSSSISGTENYVAKFGAGGASVTDSIIQDDGSGITVGGTVTVGTLVAAADIGDGYIVADSGVLKKRTAAGVADDIEGSIDHAELGNLNSANYYHLTQANHTTLTADNIADSLHRHSGLWEPDNGAQAWFVDANGRLGTHASPNKILDIQESASESDTTLKHTNTATGHTDNSVDLRHILQNDAGENTLAMLMQSSLSDIRDGSEDGRVSVSVVLDGTIREYYRLTDQGFIVNETGRDDIAFRVEGGSNANLLVTRPSDDKVCVGANSTSFGSFIVHKPDAKAIIEAWSTRDSDSRHGVFLSKASRGGAIGSESALQDGDRILSVSIAGYGATAYDDDRGVFDVEATEAWTDSDMGFGIKLNTRANGDNGSVTPRVFIGDDGKVAIGHASPNKILDIQESASESDTALKHTNTATGHTDNSVDLRHILQNDAGENTLAMLMQSSLSDIRDGSEDGRVSVSVVLDGTIREYYRLTDQGFIVNETGRDDIAFRVEGGSNTNLLVTDPVNDRIAIGHGAPTTILDIRESKPRSATTITHVNTAPGHVTNKIDYTHQFLNDADEQITSFSIESTLDAITDGVEASFTRFGGMAGGDPKYWMYFKGNSITYGTEVVVNPYSDDISFRVEGDNNPNLFLTRPSDDKVCVGTTSTSFGSFIVHKPDAKAIIEAWSTRDSDSRHGVFLSKASRGGAIGSESALQDGDRILSVSIAGYGATAYDDDRGVFDVEATEAWTDSDMGFGIKLNTRANGDNGSVTPRVFIGDDGKVAIGSLAPTTKFYVEDETATTDEALEVTRFVATCSASADTGFGARITLAAEDHYGDVYNVGRVAAIYSDGRGAGPTGDDPSSYIALENLYSGATKRAVIVSGEDSIEATDDNIHTESFGSLLVKSNSDHRAIYIEENSGTEAWEIGVDADGALRFQNDGVTKFKMLDTNDFEMTGGANKYFYLGEATTNGSWRIYHDGTDLLFERRESNSWVPKGTFTA